MYYNIPKVWNKTGPPSEDGGLIYDINMDKGQLLKKT